MSDIRVNVATAKDWKLQRQDFRNLLLFWSHFFSSQKCIFLRSAFNFYRNRIKSLFYLGLSREVSSCFEHLSTKLNVCNITPVHLSICMSLCCPWVFSHSNFLNVIGLPRNLSMLLRVVVPCSLLKMWCAAYPISFTEKIIRIPTIYRRYLFNVSFNCGYLLKKKGIDACYTKVHYSMFCTENSTGNIGSYFIKPYMLH